MAEPIDGVLNLDKPPKITSQTAVTRVKRALGARKAGHAGTLDPDATGVLLVCIGKATRLFEALQSHDKEYVATLTLGVETDTYDAAGEVTGRSDVPDLSAVEIDRAMEPFRGDIEQVPPMYSALKRDGQPLYKLARRGEVVERPPRTVRISELEVLSVALPDVRIRVVCSRGTYIRSLAHDIGKALGCGAHLSQLVRTRSGPFRVEDAMPLSDVLSCPDNALGRIIPLEALRGTLGAGEGTA